MTGDWDYPWRSELEVVGKSARVELVRAERRGGEKND
jgi:hypothetical protein